MALPMMVLVRRFVLSGSVSMRRMLQRNDRAECRSILTCRVESTQISHRPREPDDGKYLYKRSLRSSPLTSFLRVELRFPRHLQRNTHVSRPLPPSRRIHRHSLRRESTRGVPGTSGSRCLTDANDHPRDEFLRMHVHLSTATWW